MVLTTGGPFGRAVITCSAVSSVCDTPPTILLFVNRQSYATGIIKNNGVLSVNWLAAIQSSVSQVFAGVGSVRMEDRFNDDGWSTLTSGEQCRIAAAIYFYSEIVNLIDFGSPRVNFEN